MNEFLDMGGYAKYVWSTYSISLIVLTLTVVLCKRTLTNTRKRVLRRQASLKENQT
ncbi:MAG: heme exporter protein CcmD [Gammaproteobacteria bacterium]|nr:heme exporter protein CcmD [Gammaproteobacteria bacterium]